MMHTEGGYYRGISPSALRELLTAHDNPPTWRDRVQGFLSWVMRGCPAGERDTVR